ncbi:hypothetical protein LTR56_015715 [Elasticomyces elasticus]|nr:hypothetical protein LTR56_015715 [Elasticomyces elasticus]KAK3659254.1 hypothetical protein LTR22_008521 [Elasticomyces elasticus]KAK4914780.1 hypothetical protein LTR49_017015 [Elasticomyces elasticus]KAK5754250.1 hypothetical protein LTS12_015660 [Elasticomyces elasticus]
MATTSDARPAMAKPRTLRDKIKLAIKPWTDSHLKPPFTDREMVMLACASSDVPVDSRAVFMWMLQTFPYFQGLAFTAFWDCGTDSCDSDSREIIENIKIVFQMYDTAFAASGNGDKTEYTASDAAAYSVLRRLRGCSWSPDMPFNFFKIPPELRNAIYELAFQYPASGLIWTSPHESSSVLTRDLGYTAESMRRWHHVDTYRGDPYEMLPVGELLAPLLTCRQFYTEAMPVFYRINHFILDGSDTVLWCLAASRSKYIHSISARINFSIENEKTIVAAFKRLADLDKLRVLDLSIDEGEWIRRSKNGRIKKYSTITNYPGLQQLRRVRGLSQLYIDGAPQIEALVRDDMMSPRPTASTQSSSGRKRKAGK